MNFIYNFPVQFHHGKQFPLFLLVNDAAFCEGLSVGALSLTTAREHTHVLLLLYIFAKTMGREPTGPLLFILAFLVHCEGLKLALLRGCLALLVKSSCSLGKRQLISMKTSAEICKTGNAVGRYLTALDFKTSHRALSASVR